MKNSKVSNVSPKFHLNFKQYSRKSYAAYSSMHKIIRIGTLLYVCTIINNASAVLAQTDTIYLPKVIDIEEVEIVGQKSPVLLTEIPRLVTVLSKNESESAASQSIQDLLRYSSTIDIRQRGKGGIQTDISIRGGSFDHSLVLLNGISISDPQTGHLTMILPVETEAISRVEILSGPAARVHGANAFSGAIHFVTCPSDTNSVNLTASAGSYGYANTSLTLNLGSQKIRHLIHYAFGHSSGYTCNTDYDKYNVFYQAQVHLQENSIDLQIGHANRAFGANGFYTPALPEQYEQNQMSFASISYKTGGTIKITPGIYWRRHRDRFEYFREGKNWYRFENGICISNDSVKTSRNRVEWYSQHNHHINNVVGAQLTLSVPSKIGITTLDWHARNESILSNTIGHDNGTKVPVKGYPDTYYTKTDSRQNSDIHFEQTLTFRKLYLAGGMLFNWNSYLPEELHVFPGIDMSLEIVKSLFLTASYNYTLGLPTFTDLTYEDIDNEGSLELLPYTKHSIEGGLRFVLGKNISIVNFFYEQGHDVIDWVWFEDIFKFKATNIDDYMSRGIEVSSTHDFSKTGRNFPVQYISLNYTFVDMKKEIPGEVIKYFNVRHKFSAMIRHKIIKHLVAAWNVSYTDRMGSYLEYDFDNSLYTPVDFKPYWLFDLRVSYFLKEFTFFCEATNLFDKKYIDTGSIYQPGRWLSLGIKYKFTRF
ncbi:MAG: TonB-dependent receptor [Bacteroidales bacterium]|nr:TonB-dependent receptor [Bacteroidales bacterium]